MRNLNRINHRVPLFSVLFILLLLPGAALAAAAENAEARKTITLRHLLREMTDLQRLAEWPSPAYTNKQFSSYDRASKSPEENWFGNGDRGNFLRKEQNGGRTEHVMMDAKGPGAVVRIWSADPVGTLRIYVDGEPEPVIEERTEDLLGGRVEGLPVPLAGTRARGYNLYYPIPYAESCKVTCDQGGFYYHVNYRTYEDGTRVKSFEKGDLKRAARHSYRVAGKLTSGGDAGRSANSSDPDSFEMKLASQETRVVWSADNGGMITRFSATIDAEDIESAARALVLEMEFDGETTVECPLGDFFGTAPGLDAYTAYPMGITDGDQPEMWSRWNMPYEQRAEIRLKNLGSAPVEVKGTVSTDSYEWTDRSLHFHTGWRIQRDLPTRPLSDWAHLETQGQGRLVGSMLHIQNPVRNWWGEGDEKIYVDGERFPSTFGTGTEDYYGYAWCCNWVFEHAYHNQPRCDGPGNYGNTSNNRFHIIDDIPFTKSLKFDIENWHHAGGTQTTRAAATYWYARPGATDFFAPLTAEDVKLDKMQEFKVERVPGAIEGESMPVLEITGGKATPQNLEGYVVFPGWSDAQQVWWREGKPGDKLTLGFESPAAGRHQVIAQFTKAIDYGQINLFINGKPAGKMIDLYHDSVIPSGEIRLGEADLKKGRNQLTIELVGANEAAKQAYMFGLDYIRIE